MPHSDTRFIEDGQTFNSPSVEGPWSTHVLAYVRAAMGLPHKDLEQPPLTAAWLQTYILGIVGDTANHRGLARVWLYAWAMQFGNDSEQALARRALLAHFEHQFTDRGQYDAETLTTDHYQLHAHIGASARLLGVHHDDEPVASAAGRWWRRDGGLYELMLHDGLVFSPFSRGDGPHCYLRSVNAAMLAGRSAVPDDPARHWNEKVSAKRNPLRNEGAPFWSESYNASAWTLRELRDRYEDDLGGALRGETEPAVLRDELHVYREGRRFLFHFPVLSKAGPGAMYSVRSEDGNTVVPGRFYPGMVSGPDPDMPVPRLEGATLRVVPGSRGHDAA